MARMSETLALALIVACAERYEADVWIDPSNKLLRFGFDDPDEAEHFMNDLQHLGIPYDSLTHLLRQ
jgi:hypothetical protein